MGSFEFEAKNQLGLYQRAGVVCTYEGKTEETSTIITKPDTPAR